MNRSFFQILTAGALATIAFDLSAKGFPRFLALQNLPLWALPTARSTRFLAAHPKALLMRCIS